MMRTSARIVFSSFVCLAASAAQVEVCVMDADGVSPRAADFTVDAKRSTGSDGCETVMCKVTSKAEGTNLVRIVARIALSGGKTTVFDGHDELPFGGERKRAMFLDDTFMMGAAWKDGGTGTALALGAESSNSYADFTAKPGMLEISVHAAFVKKGGVYETAIHAFPFCAKYGARDAFARYYALYPKRFKRDPSVDPAIYGISAQYRSWRMSNPEQCRMMNASWDWCITAARLWGDINGRERPTTRRNTDYAWEEGMRWTDRHGEKHAHLNADLGIEEYSRLLDGRLADAYFCGVANAYYMMILAKISPVIAARYPDSVAVGKTFTDGGFSFATEVFVFPELSWYGQLRKDLAALASERDIGAVALDVAFPRGVFRGAKLAEMQNVSWDEVGPGIVRGVGAGKLYEYIRTLDCRNSRYKIGVVSNSNGMHISDKLYADSVMAEVAPWDEDEPFPLRRRLIVGEKGLMVWEGYKPTEFSPDFKQWPTEAKNNLLNSLAKCAVHRSLFAGASLPAGFISEYTADISHAFVRLNDAGWKPVPGAAANGKGWQVARYGLGERAMFAVNNLERNPRNVELSVFPGEIDSGRAGTACVDGCGYLFVPFFGGVATNGFTSGGERVSCEVGGLLSAVLECVGRVKGAGTLSASWHGAPGRVTLKLESIDFTGEVEFVGAIDGYAINGRRLRRLVPGGKASAVFSDGWMEGAVAAMRKAQKPEMTEIARAADDESMLQAERVARFFKLAAKKSPPVRVDVALPARTVRVLDFEISSGDRWGFATRVKRFLDALNFVRYQRYRATPPLNASERARYHLIRY